MSSLYFVAVIPPEPVSSEVTAFKKEISKRFNSCRALKSPPHITLLAPIRGDQEWEKSLSHVLSVYASTIDPFIIRLSNFASFPNRRNKNPVIYVHNEQSEELRRLHQNLMLTLREYLNLPEKMTRLNFTPHMTVAFRDLSLENYDNAWHEFKNRKYSSSFIVDRLFLLRFNLKENKWEIHKNFPFDNRWQNGPQ